MIALTGIPPAGPREPGAELLLEGRAAPFIVPAIEGRDVLLEDLAGGAMDILLDLPATAEDLAVAEEMLMPEVFTEELRELSCLVGDLLGDWQSQL